MEEHCVGLAVAARLALRRNLIDSKMCKSLSRLDTAFALVRHITKPKVDSMVEELRASLARPTTINHMTEGVIPGIDQDPDIVDDSLATVVCEAAAAAVEVARENETGASAPDEPVENMPKDADTDDMSLRYEGDFDMLCVDNLFKLLRGSLPSGDFLEPYDKADDQEKFCCDFGNSLVEWTNPLLDKMKATYPRLNVAKVRYLVSARALTEARKMIGLWRSSRLGTSPEVGNPVRRTRLKAVTKR
eukprot:TRINITY_DN38420_c0_g1_i1.p1 TRINITY_DN38420_c0_g1~~TRINITY_DN38420_c0_g1_i1.p1  ORF type:complete len:288 (+),score=46.76 TRINITY_DN38420_c0_g1_i1:128-865(+)